MAPASEPEPAPAEIAELRVVDVQPVPSPAENPLGAAVLEEVGGTRRIRVVMHKPEADQIALHLQNSPAIGPTPYAFMANLLQALGGRLVEAHITETDGKTTWAVAVVEGPGGREILNARPGDALNLALRVGAPIRIDPAAMVALQFREAGGGSAAS